jgi:hypothetical protein
MHAELKEHAGKTMNAFTAHRFSKARSPSRSCFKVRADALRRLFGLIDIQSASLYMQRGVGSSLFSAASPGEQSKWYIENCSAAATF